MPATPSRRHLLKAGAWAAPAVVLASAAPAYATSTRPTRACSNVLHLLNWSTASMSGTATIRTAWARPSAPVPVGSTVEDVRVTLTSAVAGNMVRLNNRGGQNMTVTSHQVGGLGTVGLELYQGISTGRARSDASQRNKDVQSLSVVFDREVTGLSFTITDIDSGAGQFADRVAIEGAAYTATRFGDVNGDGTAARAWSGSTTNVDHKTSGDGNVKVTFTQPLTAFSLRFWNASSGSTTWYGAQNVLANNGAQAIFLSNLSFTASTCA